MQADVADEDAVAAMFDTAEQEFGGVDVVAYVAGKMVRELRAGTSRSTPWPPARP
ncbi:hypothetical protein [Streptomyces swartbergensis]|uniref:hypothetical protein n=1 Tax=Streptomyces swartbergensis TaxID=487165 RepID=UPI0031344740